MHSWIFVDGTCLHAELQVYNVFNAVTACTCSCMHVQLCILWRCTRSKNTRSCSVLQGTAGLAAAPKCFPVDTVLFSGLYDTVLGPRSQHGHV
jgi:hypothetical protein